MFTTNILLGFTAVTLSAATKNNVGRNWKGDSYLKTYVLGFKQTQYGEDSISTVINGHIWLKYDNSYPVLYFLNDGMDKEIRPEIPLLIACPITLGECFVQFQNAILEFRDRWSANEFCQMLMKAILKEDKYKAYEDSYLFKEVNSSPPEGIGSGLGWAKLEEYPKKDFYLRYVKDKETKGILMLESDGTKADSDESQRNEMLEFLLAVHGEDDNFDGAKITYGDVLRVKKIREISRAKVAVYLYGITLQAVQADGSIADTRLMFQNQRQADAFKNNLKEFSDDYPHLLEYEQDDFSKIPKEPCQWGTPI